MKLLAGEGPGLEPEVLIASRSATLMKLAARLLFGPCRNVLATDLTWPVYRRILRREQCTSACRIASIALRESIFQQGISEAESIEVFASLFRENGCDGLFLPMVDVCADGRRLRRSSLFFAHDERNRTRIGCMAR